MAKLLNPLTVARLGKLHLVARTVVEGFITGHHQSPYKGYALEFSQHREYTPGDELKHLDWKVYGKTDRYVIKQYEEETNLRALIMVDASSSMSFSYGGRMTKLEYACQLAASLSYLLHRQQDSVGLAVFANRVLSYLPPRSQSGQLSRILDTLESLKGEEESQISKNIMELGQHLKKRGLVIVISDFFEEEEENVLRALKSLTYKRHEVLVFQILDPAEKEFPFHGNIRFEGVEDRSQVVTNADEIRINYLRLFNDFINRLSTGCRDSGIDYFDMTTDSPLEKGLGLVLSRRSKRSV